MIDEIKDKKKKKKVSDYIQKYTSHIYPSLKKSISLNFPTATKAIMIYIFFDSRLGLVKFLKFYRKNQKKALFFIEKINTKTWYFQVEY